MNFGWSEAQLELKKKAKDFALKHLNSEVSQKEQTNSFPLEEWQKCAEFGVLGWPFPKEYGGAGYEMSTSILMLEGLGFGSEDNGLPFSLNSQLWSTQMAINAFGTEEQKQKYLKPLIAGKIGAFGITEEDSGSDTYSLKMCAERVDGGYVLNGEKHYITLAPICDIAVVFATTNPKLGKWGITAFIVDRSCDGFTVSEVREKVGMRTTPMGNLYFKDCFVSESNRLGKEGAGLSLFSSAMESERGYIFASQVGRMEKQLEKAVEYANSRKSFGKTIGTFQSISNRIANMRLRLETCKMHLYKVAYLDDHDLPLMKEAAMAKLYISEAFVESSMDFIRIFGAKGVVTEFEIERDLRDGLGGLIYSGTSDIQRNIIAKLEGLL
ncbi:acyl-CoA dehydrogenase family protein [Algoriphagus halophytocola]|uniref:Acyl-CoA dehydrogenase family protein n=1 Tax=Algoriphagus halophytocola TaxID=2991499 RepID=A0ABY6MI60_9BACT|nr:MULTISPECIES: acyl-CoA dehydrogenase family protein [unclassified Algoriphagus]UZD23481.1 acyl-CoA dehydrogenase family protein [Algoriphagus sp. TR-M5]WBL44775.1 acyl-CoA dehydrogenase family protein [Algoriphagus sp. TR-M9]